MKKVLSLFLAVLMIFAAMSVSASAAEFEDPWHGFDGAPASNEQAVLKFVLEGGKLKSSQYIYDTKDGKFKYASPDDIGDVYVMVPQDATSMKPGYSVSLPQLTAPKGYQFDGWYLYTLNTDNTITKEAYSATWGGFIIPKGAAGKVLEFHPAYSPAEVEEDTLTKIIGILVQIFGTIIGLLAFNGDTEAGSAFLEKLLGGIVG